MPRPRLSKLRAITRLLHETSGAAALVIALAMPIMIGGLGLAVDVGLWYTTERRLQNAADAAAFAAAFEDGRDGYEAVVLEEARFGDNFRGEAEDLTLTVESDGVKRLFRVTLAEDRPDIFVPILSSLLPGGHWQAGRIRVTAGAELETVSANPCVHALDETASPGVRFQGTPRGFFRNCDIYANSAAEDAISAKGAASLGANCAFSHGGVVGSLDLDCGDPRTGAAILEDPFENEQRFTELADGAPAGCTGQRTGSTLTAGRHCGGISLRNQDGTVHLEPGVHYVDTEFQMRNGSGITGENVTLVFLGDIDFRVNGGFLDLQGGAEDLDEMLFYFDPGGPGRLTHNFAGNAQSRLGGVIYAPAGDMRYRGGAENNDRCLRFVSATVDFGGNSGIRSLCDAQADDAGGSRRVRLVE